MVLHGLYYPDLPLILTIINSLVLIPFLVGILKNKPIYLDTNIKCFQSLFYSFKSFG